MSSVHYRTKFTGSEVACAGLVAVCAALIFTAYATDTAGWPIEPAGMLVLLLLEAGAWAVWSWRKRWWRLVHLEASELFGFTIVVIGLCGAILWLASPSYLPLSQSGDVVHELMLTDFIRQRHSLIHSMAWSIYLGGMTFYPPGGYILAALLADWLGIASVHIIHPILAVTVAVKAGFLYNITLRLLPPHRRKWVIAVAGAALPLFVPAYFLGPFLAESFYSHVIGETFAVAMLWALVAWDQQPSSGLLAFFTLCGIGEIITYTFWLPIPVATLLIMLLVRSNMSVGDRVRHAVRAIGPIVLVSAAFIAPRLKLFALSSAVGGSIWTPWVIPGWPVLGGASLMITTPYLFLALAGLGLVVAIRGLRALPLLLFAGATAAQTAALFAVDEYQYVVTHVVAFYPAYKTLHLLLYPMALFAALALDALCDWLERRWPAFRLGGRPAPTLILPPMILVLAVLNFPTQVGSTLTEPVYQCGLWAKSHSPNGCVDYGFSSWVTAYWVHLELLGNPIAWSRTDAIYPPNYHPHLFQESFAVVDFNDFKPPGDFEVLHRCGPIAVLRLPGRSSCKDNPIPIEKAPLPNDEDLTLRAVLNSVLGGRRF